jgi:cytochrome c
VLTLTPSRGSSPLTVTYDFTGSVDPDGDTITARRIDFGDGTVVNPAANSGTHTYTDPSGNGATYTVTGTVTAGGLTSAAVVKTVSITSSAVSNITGKLYIAVGGQLYPVNPNEVLALATGAPVPAGTLPGTLIFRT